MKKFMKVCAIIVAVILTIGIILMVAGGCGGGLHTLSGQIFRGELSLDMDDILKLGDNWTWDEYHDDIAGVFSDAYERIEDRDAYETTFGAENIRNLELDLGGCAVTVTASPDGEYHVQAQKISAFQTYTEGDTLYVKGLKTGKWNLSTGMKVIIQIPEGTAFDKVEMSLGAGDFKIDAIKATEMEVELGAGRLQVDSLQTGTFACEVGAGQAVIDNAAFVGNVTLSVGAGEMLVTGSIPGNLTAECGMGNVEITVTGSTEADHNYEMECAAGNLTAGSRSVAGLVSEQSIDNGAASTYDLSCAMGNMEIRFK